jgi:hypothetical protein
MVYVIQVYWQLARGISTEELYEICSVLFRKWIWEISASGWFYYKKRVLCRNLINQTHVSLPPAQSSCYVIVCSSETSFVKLTELQDSKYMWHMTVFLLNWSQDLKKYEKLEAQLQICLNPLALELDIYSLTQHLCKMRIFHEQRSVTLGNTRHLLVE